MNIFFSDECPVKCAEYLDDKRVIKMILETGQMLSTAIYETSPSTYHKAEYTPLKLLDNGKYKQNNKIKYAYYFENKRMLAPTHKNHPSNIWTRASKSNYLWLCQHFKALCKEYTARYGKVHKCQNLYQVFLKCRLVFKDIGLTPFANCAANDEHGLCFKHLNNVHEAYQQYLNARWEKDKRQPTWYKVAR